MNHKTIWNEQQNKPTLVVNDLKDYAPADVVYSSLLRRGVFKWLAVRRQLIRLKDVWKARVTESISQQKLHPHRKAYFRGYRKALEECRTEVRALCHSARWQVPDNDVKAIRWLNNFN